MTSTTNSVLLPINILLVDDKPQNLLALAAALEEPGVTVVCKTSGESAVEYLATNECALILLDVQMPRMDGFETAKVIRSLGNAASKTPIIFVTALYSDNAFVRKGYEFGAVDYLTKPLDIDVVRAKVAIFADLYRQRKQIEQMAKAALDDAKRIHEASRESQHFRLITEAIPQLVWRANPDGSADYFSQAFLEYIGYPAEKVLGWGWSEVIHAEDRENTLKVWERCRAEGAPVSVEFRVRRADGHYRWFMFLGNPLRDGNGRLIKYYGTWTDIENQKRSRAEIEKALRVRDEFLSIASHELKTPITSLKLQLEMTKRSVKPQHNIMPNPERLMKFLDVSSVQIERLTSLIDDLLDVSRIESGKVNLNFEEVELGNLVQETVDRYCEQLISARCSVVVDVKQPVVTHCDRFRVEQVVLNLLSNAAKYGSEKPIDIIVRQLGADAQIVVKDYGMGISKEMQSKVFERFERAEEASNISGLGLGLYISREIVRAHKGDITVTSEPEKGSMFTVNLPCKPFTESSLDNQIDACKRGHS